MDSVFVCSWAPDDVLQALNSRFDVEHVNVFDTGPLPREEFDGRLAGKAGAMLLAAKVDADMLEAHASTLKVVANVAVGVDNIDVEAATRLGIQVTNTPGVLTDAVADMSMGLLLAAGRRIVESDRYTREGKFQGLSFPLFWGADLRGETLGIIGMGRIGQEVARRARGFGLRVVYNNRNRLASDREEDLGATYLSIDQLLGESRYVILLTPLTDETRHLIDADRLAMMRKDAFLINVSRGPVVHEQALIDALRGGRIAGAALDVYASEPRLTEGLVELDNVVLTPHIASGTVDTRHNMARCAASNLIAVLNGETAPNPVNLVSS